MIGEKGTNSKAGRPTGGRRGRPRLNALPNDLDTRKYLLQAASDVMIAKEGAEVSLSEIAEQAGMSAALVKYHFGNKEGMLMALMERDGSKEMQKLGELAEFELPAVAKLRLHIRGLINAYFRAPYMNQLLHSLMEDQESATSHRVSEVFIQPIAAFQKKLLEQGLREGVFRPVSSVDFYYMVVGACDHLFSRRAALNHVFGFKTVTEELKRDYADSLTGLVLRGIAPD